jgi:hypothetical protein
MFEMNFDLNWIRDKQIEIDGDQWSGMIFITDSEDNLVAIYKYEKVPVNE